ncbi:ferrochelatase [Pseudomaricurvus alkylphenolicus]|uniref:ferrochelatase n=1 Tax=Pseudomaricurvus alkylphenolicus TaxID=1306991 RepID=UPI0014246EB0|nr:ferrochelatase [Pseudomaricurvus alkylphenolicus]NIB43295.1 ferrochelatase [Pseudomaricurvus alkylphenolicus]
MESNQSTPLGVVIANLGTPTEPSASAVRSFLAEFLSDQRVVELPRLLWLPLLYGVILPLRAPRVAKNYQGIWTENGSPLKAITEQQASELAKRFDKHQVRICYAMTYGSPKLKDRIAELEQQGCERILVLPLYPQYSATTTAALYDQYAKMLLEQRNVSDVTFYKSYYHRSDYIEALAASLSQHWSQHEPAEKLLFSFHGIPKRCVDLGDPYQKQCLATADAVTKRLNLESHQWSVSFQSRLGKAEWLQPYTDKQLQNWAQQGVKSVDVICPAFAADCLETLEEINEENRELFLEAGGDRFEFVPCLNAQPEHIDMMENIVREHL